MIVFGVGITEALPIAAAELAESQTRQVVLLWAAKTVQDIFWRDAIASIKRKYGVRFQLRHLYSQEDLATVAAEGARCAFFDKGCTLET
jgi:ferredoxin-NADP reductase